MLKKIFSALCMAAVIVFAAHSQASATSVSVVLDTPSGMFSEPEKVYQTVQTSLDNIFGQYSEFEVRSVSECDAYVQIYREELDRTDEWDSAYGGDIQRDMSFKKADVEKIADHFGDDYLIYVRVSTTAPRYSVGMFSSGQKVNVTLDFRIWSREKRDLVYTKRAITTGKSNTIYIGGLGSTEHAVEKGLKKGFEDIEKEANKIRAAMSA